MEGKAYFRLTVIKFAELKNTGKRNRKYLLCKCECGSIVEVREDVLKSGGCKSCGCLKKEKAIENVKKNHKHKMSRTRIYGIWQKMKDRCFNKNVYSYKDYGGRGIKICEEWLNPELFIKWALDNGYNDNLSIDRIDNNGDYEPSNCKWSTNKEQSRNRRSNVLVEYKDKKITLKELSEITGLSYSCLHARIKKGIAMPELINKTCQHRGNREHRSTP